MILEGTARPQSSLPLLLADISFLMTPPSSTPQSQQPPVQVVILRAVSRRTETLGKVQIAISFANRCHAFAACLTLNKWLDSVNLDSPTLVTSPGWVGKEHPLSRLAMTCFTSTIQPTLWMVQRCTIHPDVTHHPASALPLSYGATGFRFLLTYFHPLDALDMIGARIPWSRSHAGTATTLYSEPLQPYAAPMYTNHCTKCGHIGHDETRCQDDIGTSGSDACSICETVGDPDPCRLTPCRHVRALFSQDEILSNRAVALVPRYDAASSELGIALSKVMPRP